LPIVKAFFYHWNCHLIIITLMTLIKVTWKCFINTFTFLLSDVEASCKFIHRCLLKKSREEAAEIIWCWFKPDHQKVETLSFALSIFKQLCIFQELDVWINGRSSVVCFKHFRSFSRMWFKKVVLKSMFIGFETTREQVSNTN